MGQFKPMVKMMTNEPTVELKLKKGGSVSHKKMKSGGTCKMTGHKMMEGGPTPEEGMVGITGAPTVGRPTGGLAPSKAPAKPSMAARRAAMARTTRGRRGTRPRATPPKGATVVMPAMKNGGALEALKEHASKPASKAHKGLKTGGVVKGQGGYKTGGVVKGQGGYAEGGIIKSTAGKTKVVTANANNSPAKTGDVKLGNGGGYKKGGATKKMAVGGRPDNRMDKPSGLALKVPKPMKPSDNSIIQKPMTPQQLASFRKTEEVNQPYPKYDIKVAPPKPMKPSDNSIIQKPMTPQQLALGRMKKGGSTKKYAEGGSVQDDGRPQKMAQGNKTPSSAVSISKLSGTFKKGGKVTSKKLQAVFKKENAPAIKAAKADSDLKYSKYQKMQKFAGGGSATFDESFASPSEQLAEMRRRKAMEQGYKGTGERDTASNEALLDSLSSLPASVKAMVKKALRGQGAVTDTETTVSRTVVPAKKRGGKV